MARAKPDKNKVHALKLPDQRRLDAATKKLFAKFVEKIGFVPNVFRSYTLRPARLELFRSYNNELMLGDSGLTKLEREMIAVVVSSVNHCHYCLVAHGAAVRVLSGDAHLGDQLAANYRAAELPSRQRAMLDFVWKLSETPAAIEESDRAALRRAKFSDEDIFDIAEVAAFYAASNRLASAVEAKPNPEYYDMGR
ncbi:MAG: peroxidase-related enzyme [Rhodospirillaceae bacterium]|nr:peroxidase-related enzyme [Rhodospirillaceae bacterium]MBT3926769.1 peroxidase-related enzyme [Rhodospirillaceae bacterium]MBT5676249.1 peroxidase-related enzyme [Rhodospirillaceae bacterium]MBT5779782.1 peroxidase-related enzyme [Rhodospirillaceae bacterium]